ncbi:MAG: aminotransferase class I/II-fold pyridoxal phosphate-dependent enzyme, partial [Xanthobacteraceae bacterium]
MVPFGGADEPLLHGGDLAAARRLFPGAAEPFIDLSTGINPNPYPLPHLPAEIFASLPDSVVLERLAAAAAIAYGAPSAACVTPAPGSQILLPLVCGLVRPGHAAILTPSYSEHARAAALAGHAVAEVGDLGAMGDAGLVVVTNPNNPDGRLFAKMDLLEVAKRLKARGGVLAVDEAFMDVGPPGASLAPEVAHGNIVVLRSFGKFFGLAGLRLGFALAAPPLAARLSASLGPWAVSG